MAVLKTELHLWTLRSQLLIAETGLGCLSYHDKSDKGAFNSSSSSMYHDEKQYYIESHGNVWTPKNKRPDKLRDHVKELEDTISGVSNIFMHWKSEDTIMMFLPSGLIYWINIDHDHGDITKVTKDSSLSGRTTLNNICDVIISSTFIALCSSEKPKLELIQFTKGNLNDSNIKKLSSLEPRITSIDLPGRPGRSQQRMMNMSPSADTLVVFWPIALDEVWPWTPMSNEEERANFCTVSLVGKPHVSAFTKTECDPVYIEFSATDSNKLLSIEKSLNSKNPKADVCVYEVTKSCIYKTRHNTVPLNSNVTKAKWDNSQQSLVLACEDNSLVLYTENLKNVLSAKTETQISVLAWHPSNCLILTLNQKGDVQIFDRALTCLSLTMEGLEYVPQMKLSNFFKGPIGLLKLQGGNLGNSDLNCSTLISEYLKSNAFAEATKLLTVMSWDIEGLYCFQCLVKIMNTLLRQPLNKLNEELLELTLGCFYAPQKALADVVILEYRVHIGNLARRFFHHLVRYSRFDKAFLLAVDINARDLFMDIYYAALDAGQSRVAAAAKTKAAQCDDELAFSDSCSSMNGDAFTDEEFGSPLSSNGSIVDSLEAAEAIVQTRINGHPPPLPPRKLSKHIPPIPPRLVKSDVLQLFHKTPSSGESTPPLPPRPKQKMSAKTSPKAKHVGEELDADGHSKVASKYHHVSGCTLPGGYTYDLGPAVTQRIIEDFNSMMVDESLDFNQVAEFSNDQQNIERKPVKVIHFGLV